MCPCGDRWQVRGGVSFPRPEFRFLLFEHLPGRLRAAFSFRYVILGSHDVSGEANEAMVRFRP